LPVGFLTNLQDQRGASQNHSNAEQLKSKGSIRLPRSQGEGASKTGRSTAAAGLGCASYGGSILKNVGDVDGNCHEKKVG